MEIKRSWGSFRFIHAADIHLDSPLRGLEKYEGAPVEELRTATRRAFDRLVNLAIKEDYDFVILAGDLYDGDWKDYSTGLFFSRCMHRLADADIPVFLLEGNHDAASQISRTLPLPENVRKFNTTKTESHLLPELGVALHGQGFQQRAVYDDLSAGYPPPVSGEFNIGVLHTSLDGKPGHAPYAPCTVSGLKARGYQYWALGHVHKREVVSEAPWIVYPGNIQGRHIKETGAKGCTLVEVLGGDVVSVEHRALDEMRWHSLTVDLNNATSQDEVRHRLDLSLRDFLEVLDDGLAAVRIILKGATSMHAELNAQREQWDAEIRGFATGIGRERLWIEKIKLNKTALAVEGSVGEEKGHTVLLHGIRSREVEMSAFSGLESELAQLARKLPAELLNAEDGFDPTAAESVDAALQEAKALLEFRLSSTPDN